MSNHSPTTPEPEAHGTTARAASPTTTRRHGAQTSLSKVPRIIGITLLTLVLSAGAFIGTAYQDFANRLSSRSTDISELLGSSRPDPTRKPTDSWEGQALNVLLLGSDSRADDNASFGEVEGMRSDTAMIIHIAADRSRVEIVSIPRDLIVELPQCRLPDGGFSRHHPLGTNEFNGARFNTAFSVGSQGTDMRYGAACAILAIETMTDLYIDDWAVIDMNGFQNMVDAIGGVEMCIEEDIDNRWAKLKLEAGCQTLDGAQALGFARARKGIGDGSDISRISRQQELMGAMASQTLSAGVLANPARLMPLLEAVAESLHTSARLGQLNNLTGLAYSLRSIGGDHIHFVTPPLGYEGNVVLQTWEMQELWENLRLDLPIVPDAVEETEDLQGNDAETNDSGETAPATGAATQDR